MAERSNQVTDDRLVSLNAQVECPMAELRNRTSQYAILTVHGPLGTPLSRHSVARLETICQVGHQILPVVGCKVFQCRL